MPIHISRDLMKSCWSPQRHMARIDIVGTSGVIGSVRVPFATAFCHPSYSAWLGGSVTLACSPSPHNTISTSTIRSLFIPLIHDAPMPGSM